MHVALDTDIRGEMVYSIFILAETRECRTYVTHLADAVERSIGIAVTTVPVSERGHGAPADAVLDHGVVTVEAVGIVAVVALAAVDAVAGGGVMGLFVAAAAAVMAGAAEGVGCLGGVGLAVDHRQSAGVTLGPVHVGSVGGGAVTTGTDLGNPGLAVTGARVGRLGRRAAGHAGSIVINGGGYATMTGITGRGRLISPDQGDVAFLDGMAVVAGIGEGQIVNGAVDVTGMGAGIGSLAVTAGAADIGASRVDMGFMGTAVRGDAVTFTAGAGSGVIPVGHRVVALAVAVAVDV